jgi:hypothetical protein
MQFVAGDGYADACPMAPEEIAHAIGVGEVLGFNLSLISQLTSGSPTRSKNTEVGLVR